MTPYSTPPMNKAGRKDWLQVIGVFGVIASLVFVGLQLRQSHEIALVAPYQAWAAAVMPCGCMPSSRCTSPGSKTWAWATKDFRSRSCQEQENDAQQLRETESSDEFVTVCANELESKSEKRIAGKSNGRKQSRRPDLSLKPRQD